MAEKQIIPAIVGLSGGFVIAGGVIALMVGLGIITRFVGITHTAKHVKGYETAILAGAIFGNLLTVHQIRIPLGIFGLVLMGVLFGIFVGGWIGQAILNYGDMLGLEKDIAASWCSLILIFVSVILTGLNIYPKLAKFGGAGTLVPITGFANSVAASAIEYQKEGQVFGIGCKIFTIAGPVILYGIFSSWVLGLIYWIFQVTVYQM